MTGKAYTGNQFPSPQDDPGGTHPPTPLHLPGEQLFTPSMHGEDTVALSPPPPSNTQLSSPIPLPPLNTPPPPVRPRRPQWPWLLTVISWLITIILAIGLLFSSLPSSRPNPQTSIRLPTSALTPTTPSSTTATGKIVVIPDHFHAETDCQIDNGFRCTATIVCRNTFPHSDHNFS